MPPPYIVDLTNDSDEIPEEPSDIPHFIKKEPEDRKARVRAHAKGPNSEKAEATGQASDSSRITAAAHAGDTDDLQIVGDNGLDVLKNYTHGRHDCLHHKHEAEHCSASNASYCDKGIFSAT
eukprot:gene17774-24148_t